MSDAADIESSPDAIVRVCSYHRRDFDLVVVRSRPHDMEPVQASLQAPFETSPAGKLSNLERLPTELMWMVLRELDVRSLFDLRQASRQTRILATGLLEYGLVSKHGLEGLRGVLRAGLARYFTISDLYQALITSKCSTCDDFGGLLYLLTLERCCFSCLQSADHYRVLPPSAFAKMAHISPNRIKRSSVRILRTVPGIYNMMETPARRPKHLLSEDMAAQVLFANKNITEDVIRNLDSRKEQADQRFMAATAFPWYDTKEDNLERGVCCKGCHVRLERLRGRYNGNRWQVFSTRSFLSHFVSCVEAQVLWAESKGGSQKVQEPEFTRRCGYFRQSGPDGLPA